MAQKSKKVPKKTKENSRDLNKDLTEFLYKQAGILYEETKAMRGCRNISPETWTKECGPLVDYDN